MSTVLLINSTLNVGSTGRIAEHIGLLAQQNGWDVYYAHGGRYVGVSELLSIQISSRFDNFIHAACGEFLGRHGLGSFNATKKFIEVIQTIKPDIIHLHNIHGYYLNYKVLFEYLATAKIPIVWTLHDCWSFTGHCTHFENEGCKRWMTECNHCPLTMAQYKSRFVDRSNKNYLLKKKLYGELSNVTLVPVSDWLANYLSMSILGRFPIRVIHNGIDIDIFKPRVNNIREIHGIDKDKTILLGVLGSGFDKEKGRSEFVELSKINVYQIILVGLTNEDIKGLPDNIIKIKRTNSQRELADYYSAADVFLNPTYNDTLPTTNIEAQACGTPVVTYKAGGSPETIDEKTGIVVEKGNVKGLIDAINIISKNGKQTYSSACRERAKKFFNKYERFADYISLYESLIANRHR